MSFGGVALTYAHLPTSSNVFLRVNSRSSAFTSQSGKKLSPCFNALFSSGLYSPQVAAPNFRIAGFSPIRGNDSQTKLLPLPMLSSTSFIATIGHRISLATGSPNISTNRDLTSCCSCASCALRFSTISQILSSLVAICCCSTRGGRTNGNASKTGFVRCFIVHPCASDAAIFRIEPT